MSEEYVDSLVRKWQSVERERDEAIARAVRAEAALRMLWTYYLLPISDEQRAQVEAALADTGEGEK